MYFLYPASTVSPITMHVRFSHAMYNHDNRLPVILLLQFRPPRFFSFLPPVYTLRRWANIEPALGECLVFAGYGTFFRNDKFLKIY